MGARNIVTLPDGRRLSYRAFGDPSGAPLLYFHGTPSSSVEFEGLIGEELPRRLGLRVLAPDRPGIGRSDPAPARQITDWPDDMVGFVETFGIKRFAVLGHGAGTAYALACAAVLGSRVTSATVVSPMAPHLDEAVTSAMDPSTLKYLQSASTRPFANRMTTRMLARSARRTPAKLVARLAPDVPTVEDDADAARLATVLPQTILEATEQGPKGVLLDQRLVTHEHEVPLDLIDQTVRIWHGSDDASTPPVMAEYLERSLPSAERRQLDGEGHLSILTRRAEEILTETRIATAAR